MENSLRKYTRKKPIDPFTRIDGSGLSPIIPDTQVSKILALKEKHAPLFYSKKQLFEMRLKKFEPK